MNEKNKAEYIQESKDIILEFHRHMVQFSKGSSEAASVNRQLTLKLHHIYHELEEIEKEDYKIHH